LTEKQSVFISNCDSNRGLNWWRKMSCVWQSATQKNLEKVKWKWSSSDKAWIARKEDSLRLVGLQGYTVFWAIIKGLMLTSTVNLTICVQQLKKERPNLINRKEILFHHDNANTRHFKCYKKKVVWVGLGASYLILLVSWYCADYHLFRSLQNSLTEKKFASEEAKALDFVLR